MWSATMMVAETASPPRLQWSTRSEETRNKHYWGNVYFRNGPPLVVSAFVVDWCMHEGFTPRTRTNYDGNTRTRQNKVWNLHRQ
jgi:hypothetical protein